MAKKYNIGSKSDMRRFERDLKNDLMKQVRNGNYEVSCPHCNRRFSAHSGANTCPYCRNTVSLQINV